MQLAMSLTEPFFKNKIVVAFGIGWGYWQHSWFSLGMVLGDILTIVLYLPFSKTLAMPIWIPHYMAMTLTKAHTLTHELALTLAI